MSWLYPKITRLRIGSHPAGANVQLGPPPRPDNEHNYWAEVIEYRGEFYYLAKGLIVEITEIECRRVVGNPVLYYFSTALKLHLRIEHLLRIQRLFGSDRVKPTTWQKAWIKNN